MYTTANSALWVNLVTGMRWVLFIPLGFIGGLLTEYVLRLAAAFVRLTSIGPHDPWDGSILIFGAAGAATVIVGAAVAPTENKLPGLIMGALGIGVYSACSVIMFLAGETYMGVGAIIAGVGAACAAYQCLPETFAARSSERRVGGSAGS